MKRLVYLLIVFFSAQLLIAQSVDEDIEKQTLLYSIKGSKELFMDVYRLQSIKSKQPVLVFLFGGGFRRGERDNKGFLPYFHFLAQNGITVVSIDYRLGMQDKKRTDEFLNKAIQDAVEDLYDATLFIIEHADDLNVNSDLIVLNGSSAGGMTVLQSVYELNTKNTISQKLPANFQYAGAIAFSGAIMTKGEMEWQPSAPPIFLFHGDVDDIVPYDQILTDDFGLYGSSVIAKQLEEIRSPSWMITFNNEKHNVTGLPRNRYKHEILKFINDMAINKDRMSIRTNIKRITEDGNDIEKDK